jgi:hypothetical protein
MDELNLPHLLISQYQASLAMLGQAIEICPEDLWLASDYRNKFWHIAYHALFYTYFYLQAGEADFPAWAKHQADSQYLSIDRRPRPSAPNEDPPVVKPYSRVEMLEYHKLCCAEVEASWGQLPGSTGYRLIRWSSSFITFATYSITRDNWLIG